MKSFSSHSFSGATSADLAEIEAAVRENPFALFTDFQWYLYQSQNTVFFSAYTEQAYTRESLHKKVAEMVSLAPQLTHGFMGAKPGQAFPQQILDAVVTLEEVDSFEGYPDKWLEPGLEIFEQRSLPLFRVKGLVLKGGPDAEGRASMFLFRCSHALMEGSDSALLTRSQSAAHGSISNKKNKVPLRDKLKFNMIGAMSGTIQMLMAHTNRRPPKDIGLKTVALERQQLRRVAQKLGIGQRAVMFALVMHALNDGGKGVHPKVISAAYTMLDTNRQETDDDFFRVNTVLTKFNVVDDLVAFARSVEEKLKECEAKDPKKMQYILNATFSTHRRWARLFPFLYGRRFFNYGGEGLVLTLIPPHRIYGNLTQGLREHIHAGSWHPGANLCTFVPAKEYATLNFSMEMRHIAHAGKIQALLDELERKLA